LIRFQADSDLRSQIVQAVRHTEPAIEFVSAFEGGIVGLPDPEVLGIVAQKGRILVTHDRRTMPMHLRDHLIAGRHSPGVLVVAQHEAIGPVAEALSIGLGGF
jgi:hypothetical protein